MTRIQIVERKKKITIYRNFVVKTKKKTFMTVSDVHWGERHSTVLLL